MVTREVIVSAIWDTLLNIGVEAMPGIQAKKYTALRCCLLILPNKQSVSKKRAPKIMYNIGEVIPFKWIQRLIEKGFLTYEKLVEDANPHYGAHI